MRNVRDHLRFQIFGNFYVFEIEEILNKFAIQYAQFRIFKVSLFVLSIFLYLLLNVASVALRSLVVSFTSRLLVKAAGKMHI